MAEFKRRSDRRRQEELDKYEEHQEKIARKKVRTELREELRLSQLMDSILESGVINSNKFDITSSTIVLDIGEPLAFLAQSPSEVQRRGAIYSFGGLTGELILTFTCLLDYILTNPANEDFKFTQEQFENFLLHLLDKDHPHLQLWLDSCQDPEEPFDLNG
jgi:hypothetical protein